MKVLNFIKGLKLNEGYYNDIVKPIIESTYPELKYSAGLIGYGSDVLGFDTHVSIDHNWGPRLVLFLNDNDISKYRDDIDKLLRNKLPYEYKGFSTNFTDPLEDGVQRMKRINKGKVNHLIKTTSIEEFLKDLLGVKNISNIQIIDWLKFSDQGLIEVTKGKIFHDGLNKLKEVREYFNFFPEDILRLKLASLWHYIAQEEAFVGRNVDLGEYLGVKIITTRIVNALMKICFYLEKEYIPYSKWFSRSFKKLIFYNQINDIFMQIVSTEKIENIEELLCTAYQKVLLRQNKLGLTKALKLNISNFHGRPYKVVFTENISRLLIDSIADEDLKNIKIDYVSLIQNIDGIDLTNNKHLLGKIYSE